MSSVPEFYDGNPNSSNCFINTDGKNTLIIDTNKNMHCGGPGSISGKNPSKCKVTKNVNNKKWLNGCPNPSNVVNCKKVKTMEGIKEGQYSPVLVSNSNDECLYGCCLAGERPEVKFSCINNQCVPDPNGNFNTVNDCLKFCQRFDCDPMSGQCIENGEFGEFSSLSECTNSCGSEGSPLLIPKNNVSYSDVEEEIQTRKNLTGSLESGKLRFESSYVHLLFNIILVITICAIIGYYLFNKKDDLMSTGISLILALIILYVICKYIYDNYITVAKIYY